MIKTRNVRAEYAYIYTHDIRQLDSEHVLPLRTTHMRCWAKASSGWLYGLEKEQYALATSCYFGVRDKETSPALDRVSWSDGYIRQQGILGVSLYEKERGWLRCKFNVMMVSFFFQVGQLGRQGMLACYWHRPCVTRGPTKRNMAVEGRGLHWHALASLVSQLCELECLIDLLLTVSRSALRTVPKAVMNTPATVGYSRPP